MTTTLNIQADILQGANSIPYKYGVLNFMSDNITCTSEFEFLHGAPPNPNRGSQIVNRCLIIPTASYHRGGMLH